MTQDEQVAVSKAVSAAACADGFQATVTAGEELIIRAERCGREAIVAYQMPKGFGEHAALYWAKEKLSMFILIRALL